MSLYGWSIEEWIYYDVVCAKEIHTSRYLSQFNILDIANDKEALKIYNLCLPIKFAFWQKLEKLDETQTLSLVCLILERIYNALSLYSDRTITYDIYARFVLDDIEGGFGETKNFFRMFPNQYIKDKQSEIIVEIGLIESRANKMTSVNNSEYKLYENIIPPSLFVDNNPALADKIQALKILRIQNITSQQEQNIIDSLIRKETSLKNVLSMDSIECIISSELLLWIKRV